MQETKKWLMRVRGLDVEIDILKAEKSEAEEKAQPRASVCSDERVQSTQGNTTEQKFVEVGSYSQMIDITIDEREKIKLEVFGVIKQVENVDYRSLLILYYIRGLPWYEVAEKLHRSERAVCGYLHNGALREVKKIREQSAL